MAGWWRTRSHVPSSACSSPADLGYECLDRTRAVEDRHAVQPPSYEIDRDGQSRRSVAINFRRGSGGQGVGADDLNAQEVPFLVEVENDLPRLALEDDFDDALLAEDVSLIRAGFEDRTASEVVAWWNSRGGHR